MIIVVFQPSRGSKMAALWPEQPACRCWSGARCWRLNRLSCPMLECTDVWPPTWLESQSYCTACKYLVGLLFIRQRFAQSCVSPGLMSDIFCTPVSYSTSGYFQPRRYSHSRGERGHWAAVWRLRGSSAQSDVVKRWQPCGKRFTWHTGALHSFQKILYWSQRAITVQKKTSEGERQTKTQIHSYLYIDKVECSDLASVFTSGVIWWQNLVSDQRPGQWHRQIHLCGSQCWRRTAQRVWSESTWWDSHFFSAVKHACLDATLWCCV